MPVIVGLALLVAVQRPAAGHHNARAVAPGMQQFALPPVGPLQLVENVFEAHWQRRLQQFGHVSADGFPALPAIQLLGTRVPVGDHAIHVPHHDRVMRLVEQRRLIRQVLGRLLVLQREEGRDADGAEADQTAYEWPRM